MLFVLRLFRKVFGGKACGLFRFGFCRGFCMTLCLGFSFCVCLSCYQCICFFLCKARSFSFCLFCFFGESGVFFGFQLQFLLLGSFGFCSRLCLLGIFFSAQALSLSLLLGYLSQACLFKRFSLSIRIIKIRVGNKNICCRKGSA